MMKRVLAALGVMLILAVPAVAKEFVPWTPTGPGEVDTRADVVLEYDGGVFISYGSSPNWTDYTVVNFEVPAGDYIVCEVQYYVHGPVEKRAELWSVSDLFQPPVAVTHTGITWLPVGSTWPPGAFTVVDVTSYGANVTGGDLLGPGCEFYPYDGSGIGLADAYADGVPGHSWAIWQGSWTDDTYGYGEDDGIRLGLDDAGGTPTEATTWGAVKDLYR
jgi:hypothetical protein